MMISIARRFRYGQLIEADEKYSQEIQTEDDHCLTKEHHPYRQTYGWHHNVSKTQFQVIF